MDITLSPRPLSGEIPAIASKSQAHRLFICAALADRDTELRLGSTSEDIEATKGCLSALGARFEALGGGVRVSPVGAVPTEPLLDCGESGSTLRFLLPVAAALCDSASFTGRGRLPQRPNGPLLRTMEAHGARFSSDTLPLSVSRMTRGGVFEIAGNVSSQYITGLLLAAPLLPEGAELVFTTPVESRGYIDMTVATLALFGVRAAETEQGLAVAAGSGYASPGIAQVEGDWSNAAFWLVSGALGGGIGVTGLDRSSAQGDRAAARILSDMGADVAVSEHGALSRPGNGLSSIDIDASDIPDLVPVLAVAAAAAKGTTRFYNASRLRLKESDRLETTRAMLLSLGGKAEVSGGELFVTGTGALSGGTVDSAGDHRIAMSAAVASCLCAGPVTITGAEAVNKSYPGFFDDFKKLGGSPDVVLLR